MAEPIVNQVRTILGPLTTTYTPVPSCTIPVINAGATAIDAWRAQSCRPPASSGDNYENADATACWPPRSEAAFTPEFPPLRGWGFYSPGLIVGATIDEQNILHYRG